MKLTIRILFLLLCVSKANLLFAGNGQSNANGNWNNPSTWLFNGVPRIPTCGDTVTIPAVHTITVNNQQSYGCTTPIIIIVDGILEFTNGNKLDLPCGSVVYINPGGLIRKATSGGGNSTLISICGSVEWSAGDGDLPGPAVLGTPLPIELLEFDAKAAGDHANIFWTTATEINNDYFTLEKSKDGILFSQVAIIDGAGNSTRDLHYVYADYNVSDGRIYYRLKQTDYDGAYSYSPTVAVYFSDQYRFEIISAFVRESSSLHIEFINDISGPCNLMLHDLSGKLIYRIAVSSDPGLNTNDLFIPGVSSGIYLVSLDNGEASCYRKATAF